MRFDAAAFLDRLYRPPSAPTSVGPGDLPADWLEMWEERAGIREFDGRLPRDQAEAAALADVLTLLRERGLSLPPWRDPEAP